jgi:Fic family protein
MTYIWQRNNWTNWRYDVSALALPLAAVCSQQGRLYGRLDDLGMAQRDMALLDAITKDVIKTSEIEGEQLNLHTVRSSVARRLGVDIGALAPVDRQVEGIVEMVLDATLGYASPLSKERLLGWHFSHGLQRNVHHQSGQLSGRRQRPHGSHLRPSV